MDCLLDTHSFLWFINGDNALSLAARKHIEDISIAKYVSLASLWEVAIKVNLGKLQLDMPFNELQEHITNNGFELLPITFEHTAQLSSLNTVHKDPFDRMIICQAITEQLAIVGKDSNFHQYNVTMIW